MPSNKKLTDPTLQRSYDATYKQLVDIGEESKKVREKIQQLLLSNSQDSNAKEILEKEERDWELKRGLAFVTLDNIVIQDQSNQTQAAEKQAREWAKEEKERRKQERRMEAAKKLEKKIKEEQETAEIKNMEIQLPQ